MVHAILVEQGQNATELNYHAWWPSASDPWYMACEEDQEGRIAYYGVNSVPDQFVDGTHVTQSGAALRNAINARRLIPSHVWLGMRAWADASGDSVFMEVQAVADSANRPGFRLYMAAAEIYRYRETIIGLSDWYGGLYRMYPNAQGLPFTHDGDTADTLTFVARFGVRHEEPLPMTLDNFRFVAWVQDTAGREVQQSAAIEFPLLITPPPGDTLYVTRTTTLRWSPAAFDSGNVTIELNRDYPGGPWETILADIAGTGSAAWTVTGPPATHARFRIYKVAEPALGDTTAGDLRIEELAALAAGPIQVEAAAGDTLAGTLLISNSGPTEARVTLAAHTGSAHYAALHSGDPGGPAYAWVPTESAWPGPTGNDEVLEQALPFPVTFYGETYTTAWMSTNGWLSFVEPSGSVPANDALPSEDLSGLLAVFWDDLTEAGDATTRIYWDEAGERVVFSWNRMRRWGEASARISAQVILYADGQIVYQYGLLEGTTGSCTVGTQNADGSQHTQCWCDEAVPSEHAIAFVARGAWARPAQQSFTVPAGGSYSLPYVLDARNIFSDTVLTGTWELRGNFADLDVPVTLTVTASSGRERALPAAFALTGPYPNPFNPSTTIEFSLAQSGRVRMMVYDITGRVVTTVADGVYGAGPHREIIHADQWAAGMYFLHVEAAGTREARKLLLVK